MRLYLVECSLLLAAFVVGLWVGLGQGLDLVGWLLVMHTYFFYYFRLSLSHCPE